MKISEFVMNKLFCLARHIYTIRDEHVGGRRETYMQTGFVRVRWTSLKSLVNSATAHTNTSTRKRRIFHMLKASHMQCNVITVARLRDESSPREYASVHELFFILFSVGKLTNSFFRGERFTISLLIPLHDLEFPPHPEAFGRFVNLSCDFQAGIAWKKNSEKSQNQLNFRRSRNEVFTFFAVLFCNRGNVS